MDWRALLSKYIDHVGDTEGVDFIPSLDHPDYPENKFTREEIECLNKVDDPDFKK